ncbi:MAG: UDP-N-acetylmuramate:L-alanyl-gamma-D-glutamyl-meso-diaminopimelate ligase [Myxococcales bacterium]|nr:MAG: UDP-N-acetylmuramate:L-alanyl-gamma-D-glutamyl-meso-diaminopimelate ligase [Myxococcales bacterium]
MKIHVVAVAGTGMGALAGLLAELGHGVSGSDVAFDPPIGPALVEWGVETRRGFDAAHLSPAPDLVVIGNVCRPTNVEARAAIDGGLEYTHIAGALDRFVLLGTSPLVVAGTHGKTTTSSLAAWLLESAGLQPGFLIGGLPKNFPRGFRAPRREAERRLPTGDKPLRRPPFVLEGDEYDTAFFEKTAKFLHYRAEVVILTSIEHDHIDIYATLEAYLEAFRQLLSRLPENGLVVANAADPLVRRVVDEALGDDARVAWYALEGEDTGGKPPHWLAAPATFAEEGTTFDLFAGGVLAGRFLSPLPGHHNLRNAVAALGACAQGYGAKLKDLGPALARFAGVRRRQDLLGAPRGIFVYDDFAHHPTAVRETLRALRQKHPSGKLFAVFEPRSATACRNLHQSEYVQCWDDADEVLLAPLGRDNLPEAERLDLAAIVSQLEARGRVARQMPSVDAILDALCDRAAPGDTIALLSNGAFGGIHGKLITRLGA